MYDTPFCTCLSTVKINSFLVLPYWHSPKETAIFSLVTILTRNSTLLRRLALPQHHQFAVQNTRLPHLPEMPRQLREQRPHPDVALVAQIGIAAQVRQAPEPIPFKLKHVPVAVKRRNLRPNQHGLYIPRHKQIAHALLAFLRVRLGLFLVSFCPSTALPMAILRSSSMACRSSANALSPPASGSAW